MRIDFAKIADERASNISGHQRGSEAREFFNLDDLDDAQETVEVVVPEYLDGIATSFFQGMFSKSVRKFGDREAFLAHYRFFVSPQVMQQVLRGIRRSLTERNGAAFKR